jgi:hypothetical protein
MSVRKSGRPAGIPSQREYDEYIRRCVETLRVAFEEDEKMVPLLRTWLGKVGSDMHRGRVVVHYSPLRTVAQFLGIDPQQSEFLRAEGRYRRLAKQKHWER